MFRRAAAYPPAKLEESVPRALLGNGSCRRCGSFRSQAGVCAACGAVWSPAAASTTAVADAGLTGVVRASLGRRYLADLIDLVIPVALAAAAIVAFMTTPEHALGWLLLGVAVAVAVVELGWLLATGRSPGRLLVGLRTVDDLTGTPIRFARFRRQLAGAVRGRLLTADLRNGRDPMQPQPMPVAIGGSAPAASGDQSVAGGFGAAAPQPAPRMRFLTAGSLVWIAFEDGSRWILNRPAVIGRDPDTDGRDGVDALALPDLSRRLDKTHLLIERSESTVWVTDLDSATGTAVVRTDGVRTPLAAEVRSAVPIGATIEAGGRRLVVLADG
ncbi:RDD family protein [Microlunatus endophyticus]|nr:RDD family protein [Microlunatus endophyticus]